MDRVLRVSASTGSMHSATGGGEECGRWAYVAGERSFGRLARHSIRTASASATSPAIPASATAANNPTSAAADVATSAPDVEILASPDALAAENRSGEEPIGVMEDDGQLAVEVDAQVMQLTLKASHPQVRSRLLPHTYRPSLPLD